MSESYAPKGAAWKNSGVIHGDVVFFSYVEPAEAKVAEEVYIWDLDKTYLDTKFETFKGLARAAFEKAFQKRNVPGTAALVAALKTSCTDRALNSCFPIYFVTASPPQLERKIFEKLRLDGVRPYGLLCKDNLRNLHPKRLWRLTQQIGFKLQALLEVRITLSENVRQVLFGDDSESDAIVYNLYSDICGRRRSESEIRGILKGFRVVGTQMDSIMALQKKIPSSDPVEKIYINLAEDTDAEYYLKFGRRTLPTFNSFQIGLDLYQDGRMGIKQLVEVGVDMVSNFGFSNDEIEKSLDDLIRRQVLGRPCVEKVLKSLKEHKLINQEFEPSVALKEVAKEEEGRIYQLEGSFEPWVSDKLDYFHDYS